MRVVKLAALMLVLCSTTVQAQFWSGILDPKRAIDWTQAGIPGEIPNRTTNCATIQASTYGNGASDATTAIQAALNSCPSNQVVSLSAGTFRINSSLRIPSNVTLRGAGAKNTILDLYGSSQGAINMGSGDVPLTPNTAITSGATKGSTSIGVSSVSGITVGSYLVISELNNPSYVKLSGFAGACTWCDNWSDNGARARGQIVEVTSVSGTTLGITPALYSDYTLTPLAHPFNAVVKYAGVEYLQVRANNTGYTGNFQMRRSAYCWIKGVTSNFADGDHAQVAWSYRNEIRDSYFHDAYKHTSGGTDSDIFLISRTSATLVENNILERLHVGIMFNWGAAGNVAAYNYSTGHFDSNATNVLMGDLIAHGAHPQFNLLESNSSPQFRPDSNWGSSSHWTAFRNWTKGTTFIAPPYTGRGVIQWGSGHWASQGVRAMSIDSQTRHSNFVGNVVGSADLNNLGVGKVPMIITPTNRSYETVYGYSFGYGDVSDSGGDVGNNTDPYTTALLHGEYNWVDGSTTWSGSLTRTLPPSFYLPGKPSWWGSITWPAIGPDVAGGLSASGGRAHAIPSQNCYATTAKDSNGSLLFDPSVCYGQSSPGPTPQPPPAPTGLTVK